MQLALTPANPSDNPFLKDLFCHVRAPEFSALQLPPTALNQLLDMQYRAQKLGYAGQFPSAEDAIVRIDGQPAGRLLIARSVTEIHIIDIALLDSYRNQGIGATLLRTLSEEARATNKTLSLSVHFANPAQRLYRRLGFTPTANDGINITMAWAAEHNTSSE